MQHITITLTRYHTCYNIISLSLTWIGHNAMRYHNFSELQHALPSTFSQFSMVWSLLKHVTTRYHQTYKK